MKRLLFIVTEDWYFVSHRLHLAQAAIRQGYHVAILCRVDAHHAQIEAANVQVINWQLERGSLNPLREFQAMMGVIMALRQFKPDLIHSVALKPALYSAFAAQITGYKRIAYSLGGLGFVFSSKKPMALLVKPFLSRLYRWIFSQKHTRLILQNPDDCTLLVQAGIALPDKIRLIRGAGVDVEAFAPQPTPAGVPLVILPARLLWSKGVGEFVETARRLRNRGIKVRFALVGAADKHNPECVSEQQLQEWRKEGVVELWGHHADMREVFNQATLVCLPSYREGLPKALLEAASCGKPIVTFDVPGCREAVEDGKNGLLIPFKDVEKLADGIEKLLSSPALCEQMGQEGRKRALQEFSQDHIAAQTSQVWDEIVHS